MSLQKILFYVGIAFLLPGLAALGYSLYEGPMIWATDKSTFWGTPIALFVFWIGLAHAGTLLSAIFLALGIRLDRRTAVIAELSTLCCLGIAALFPLMHLGVLENFYMVAPFADARGNFANVRSPLVWDFCCIGVYGVLSLIFFLTHIKGKEFPALTKIRRPFAWLLFPLVLWVHTVVSLDFASTFVPQWQGAFFPVYFIVGAVYSGLALVNALLWTEGYRVRMLERLMMSVSWILMVIWFWDFLQKGECCLPAVILAGVIPQILFVERIRENRICRDAVNFCILFGLFAERLYLVVPALNMDVNGTELHWVDYGLMSFSVGVFILSFFYLRRKLEFSVSGDNSYFGEVDGSDLAQNEISEISEDGSYKVPWATEEFLALRTPLLIGALFAVLFCVWGLNQDVFDNVNASLVNVFPMTFPIVALVAALVLCSRLVKQGDFLPGVKKRFFVLAGSVCILGSFLLGMLYAGGPSVPSLESQENQYAGSASHEVSMIWNARCATCHGRDGSFNEMFVREFYPVPQKLDAARVDSVGVDSLAKVILNGRNNMNAFRGRLSEQETRALAEYMRALAHRNDDASSGESTADVNAVKNGGDAK